MNFGFTEEQEELRHQVRSFLEAELPSDWVGYVGPTTGDRLAYVENDFVIFRNIATKIGERGWLTLCWPKEYGGEGHFSEVFFDDIVVPSENMLGKENEGWKVVQTILKHEHGSIEFVAMADSIIKKLQAFLKNNPQMQSTHGKYELAGLAIEA